MPKRNNYLLIIFFATLLMAMITVTQWFSNKSTNTLNKGNLQAVETFKINNRIQKLVNSSFSLYTEIISNRNSSKTADSLTTLGYNSTIISDAIKKIGIPDSLNKIKEVIANQVEISSAIIEADIERNGEQKKILIDSLRGLNISDKVYEACLQIQKLLEKNLQSTLVANSNEASTLYGLNKYLAIITILAIIILVTNIINRQEKQRKLIKSLQIAEAAAQKSKQAKDEFLANMSHELRTPLNALIGFSNILNNSPLNSKQKEYVDIIATNGENLLNIVNDILDISKIEAGKLSFKTIPFDLYHLLKSLEKLFSKTIAEKQLTYHTEVDYSIPQFIIGDNNRLKQILVNLIGNAVKFSNQGGVKIAVKNKKISASKNLITFYIHDSGPGIPADKINTIFNRFEQLEHVTTRQHGGTGLGLTIVKKLVEIMGGTIWVESELGHGATFIFELEFEKANEYHLIQKNTDSKDVADFSHVKILLVEDNMTNQKLMTHLLMPSHAQMTIVNNGNEAVSKLTKTAFDIVLMDIQMPVMDGYTAINIIRNELQLKTPVLAMTAYVSEEEIEKVKNSGFNTHIAKPIVASFLYKSIAEALKENKKHIGEEIGETATSDFSYFNALFVNDEETRKEMIEVVKMQWQEDKKRLLSSIAEKNCDASKPVIHGLKSTFSPFGVQSTIYKKIAEMEQQVHKMENKEQVELNCIQTIHFIDTFVHELH